MISGNFMVFMGTLAGVISLLAYIPYIISIVRKRTIPSRTTWWILSFIGCVTLFTYKESGAFNTIFFLVGDVIGSLLIALLSILYGRDGFKLFDLCCFFGAMMSIFLFFLFRDNSAIAFFSSLAVEVIAMIPTIKKTYLRPFEEDVSGWLFTFIAAVINLYAIETWTLIVAIYPFYEFLINGAIVFILATRRGKKPFSRNVSKLPSRPMTNWVQIKYFQMR